MTRIKNIGISILVLICFLIIKHNYNGGPSSSIFDFLWYVLHESFIFGWDFSINNFTTNFTYNLIEFILITTFIFMAAISGKRTMILPGMFALFCLWAFWLNCYKELIDVNLYLTSSIPFFISLIITNLLIFKNKIFNQNSFNNAQ